MTDLRHFGNNPVKAGSKRFTDENRYLHVEECVLTGEEVAGYLGREINGYETLGLEAETIYGIYRPLDELKKAKDSFNGLPLTDDHIEIRPERPAKDRWEGSTGTNSEIIGNSLVNTISIWTEKAINNIEKADDGSGGKKDLSCGYGYDLVVEDGMFEGKPYRFKMTNIRGNHVALVEEGRHPKAMVADSNNFKKVNTVKKSLIQILLGSFVGDKKGYDSMKPAIDAICAMGAKDAAEFEGGETEKSKHIIELANELNRLNKMNDEEQEGDPEKKDMGEKSTDKKGKDKKGKDKRASDDSDEDDDMVEDDKPEDKPDEKEEKTKDEDPEKEEKTHDQAIRARNKVVDLCTKAVGKMSDKFINDSSLEQLIDNALSKNNQVIKGKALDAKVAMLETVASMKQKAAPKRMATDSKSGEASPSIFSIMKGN